MVLTTAKWTIYEYHRMIAAGILDDRRVEITLPNDSEPEPDIAIVQRLGREYLEHHPYPENVFWLIEYSDSSLDKDLEIKSKVYAEVKIPEYWVVNLKKRQLVVFRDPQDAEYASKSRLTGGMIYPLVFPDVAVSVNLIVSA